jgi:hypothetical protein
MTPQRTEPIQIQRTASVSDGGAGTTGEAATVLDTLAVIRILKPSRTLEASQVQLRQGYEFEFWTDPAYSPLVGDLVLFQTLLYAVQGVRFADTTNRRTILTGLH